MVPGGRVVGLGNLCEVSPVDENIIFQHYQLAGSTLQELTPYRDMTRVAAALPG